MPLFLEQCVRLLVEQEVVRVTATGTEVLHPARLGELPAFMRLFVASRIDSLPVADRIVIGAAAVIGDVVDVDLLRVLTNLGTGVVEPLDRLVDRRLLEWAHDEGGELALVFHHSLVREVAYEGLLRTSRLHMHRVAAEWYAVLPMATQLEDEARHLRAAVQLSRAGFDVAVADPETARRLWDHSLDLVRQLTGEDLADV